MECTGHWLFLLLLILSCIGCTCSCTTIESIILTILAICWDGASIGADICAIGDIMKGSDRISRKTVLKNVIVDENLYVLYQQTAVPMCISSVFNIYNVAGNITEDQAAIGPCFAAVCTEVHWQLTQLLLLSLSGHSLTFVKKSKIPKESLLRASILLALHVLYLSS